MFARRVISVRLSGINTRIYQRLNYAEFHHLIHNIKTPQISCFCPKWKNAGVLSVFNPNSVESKNFYDKIHQPKQPNNTTLAAKLVDKAPPYAQPYLKLMRADKPIGTWLLYWPCAWSITLATSPGHWLPNLSLLALFGCGAFFMRGAGCTINDMWDRDIDAKVERTKSRPLASGELSRIDALAFLSGQLGISLLILLQLNWYSILLGASSLGIVIIYPLMKRYFNYPQLTLGLAFNWGALLGWSAVQGSCSWVVCLPLYLAGISWTLVYDTIYALQDKTDDLMIGVKSTALTFGDQTRYWLSLFSVSMISNLALVGYFNDQGQLYFLSLAAAGIHLAGQVITLKVDDPEDCKRKFLSNSLLGAILFFGVTLDNFYSYFRAPIAPSIGFEIVSKE